MNCAADIVREIEGRRACLRVRRDGRLGVMHAQRLPGYLIRAARDYKSAIVAFLNQREGERAARQERIEAENAEARRVAEANFMPASERLFPRE